jgi:hypothetical protein
MRKQIVFDEQEFNLFRLAIAKHLQKQCSTCRIVEREAGEEMVERIDDWWVGVTTLAVDGALKDLG